MKSWNHIVSAAAVFAFLLSGCGGGGGDGGSSTPNEQSTLTEANVGEFMTKVEGLVPGCDFVGDVNATARYGTVLPAGIIHNIRYSPEFDAIIQSRANIPIDQDCTTGSVTGTVAQDYSVVNLTFNQCNLSSLTSQNTTINGQLNLTSSGWDGNLSNFSSVTVTASTGSSGIRVTDTNLSQDVTLVLTGFSVNTGEQTQASPATVTLVRLALTDHLDSSESFQLDNCSGVGYTNLTGDSVLDLTTCTYTDEDGSFTVTSDGLLLDAVDGTVNGSVTVTATDDSEMVFTFTDSLGEVDVNLNGQDFGTLDCTGVDTSGLDLTL